MPTNAPDEDDTGRPALSFFVDDGEESGAASGAIASEVILTETNLPILDETGSALLIE